MQKNDKIILIGAGAVALVYFGVLNPLFKYLGLKQSEETINLDNEAVNPLSFWSPNFWRTVSGAKILTSAAVENMATDIYNSFGLFNDCEECVISIFKQLNYKTQVSYLSDYFYKKYGFDLLSFLRGGNYPQDRLSDKDVNDINIFLSKLPLK